MLPSLTDIPWNCNTTPQSVYNQQSIFLANMHMHAVKYLLWWWWWSLLLRLSYLVTKVILKMKCGIFFLYAYSLTTACTLIPGWNSSCLSSYCSLWSLTPLGRLVGGYMPARESLLSSSSSNQLCIHIQLILSITVTSCEQLVWLFYFLYEGRCTGCSWMSNFEF